MKQLRTFILLLAVLTSFTHAKAQVNMLDKAINKATDSYLGIKNALAANDGVAAENNAKEFLTVLNSVPVNSMTADQSKVWKKYIDRLQFDGRHISEVPRVEHQKEHFASLTKNWRAVLDGFKMNKPGV
ncbi:MAG TPA: DUF3347 domain-containing protein [Mucilaginibacter sp.]|jgi:hypothetical protein